MAWHDSEQWASPTPFQKILSIQVGAQGALCAAGCGPGCRCLALTTGQAPHRCTHLAKEPASISFPGLYRRVPPNPNYASASEALPLGLSPVSRSLFKHTWIYLSLPSASSISTSVLSNAESCRIPCFHSHPLCQRCQTLSIAFSPTLSC